PYPALFFAQDSSAGSTLFRWDGRDSSQVRPGAEDPGTDISRLCTETLYGQGYFSERPRVLVIGLGGGPDVQCALYHRAREVSVAEINPDAVRAVQGRFSAWLGGIGTDPRVTVHLQDGRSFLETALRRGAAPWDLIQLSGVDTKASLASGALSMSENHLYTVEALETALRLLAPDGAVSVIRFTEAEALRLSVTAFEALRRLGAAEPHRHVAVFHTGLVVGVVVRRSPFTAPDAQRLDAQLRPPWHRGVHVFYYSDNGAPFETMAAVDHLPHVSRQGRVGSLFDAAEAGELAAFVARQPEAITAASDDRPFFFDTLRHDRAESWAEPWVVALRDVLLGVVALSAALVLWPLRRLAASPGRRLSAATFVGLGAGYLLVEVWLFQQLTRFLGHPVYSLSVVLATLLVSTGLGALATLGSGQPAAPRRAAWALIFALGWLVACALLLPALLGLAWASSFPVRVALAVACLAPLGAALGVPFVTVLATIRARDAAAVPWFVGLNGFASVVASVAVVPLSMLFGYRVVLGTGIAAYAVALAGCWSLGRPR
ncbi:MAG: hypothetical protein FJ104_02915, partial [Deltaproteobacteria bacterium]|nr:hypothetical protein [Deltaproteobacteria bacterium]